MFGNYLHHPQSSVFESPNIAIINYSKTKTKNSKSPKWLNGKFVCECSDTFVVMFLA